MGILNSKPISNSSSDLDLEFKNNISESLKRNLIETSDVHSSNIEMFKKQLMFHENQNNNTSELGLSEINKFNGEMLTELNNNSLQDGGKRKKNINKYKKYDVTKYLEKIKKESALKGGNVSPTNNSFEELSELEGLNEIKQIIDSIENENLQTGGNYNTTPISEGIRNALVGGNFSDDLSSSIEFNKHISESNTSPLSQSLSQSENKNNSITVSSLTQSSYNNKDMEDVGDNGVGDVNILPFYSSSESASFQHPYAKNRFN
jgi:hypothetical protein